MNNETLLSYFIQKTRQDESTFWCLKDSAPEEIYDLIRECHFDMLPNDWSFSLIVQVLQCLSETPNYDSKIDYIEFTPSVYNADLLSWLSSNTMRIEFVDEASEELCLDSDVSLMDRIREGQLFEMNEILGIINEFIRK